jgi:hypothetical protein
VAGLTLKRRYFGRKPAPDYAGCEGMHGPSVTMPDLSDTP